MDILDFISVDRFLGVAGICLAVYFYLRTKLVKKVSYCAKETKVVTDRDIGIENILLSVNGQTVDRLTITDLVIWNSGTQPILRSDLVANSECSVDFELGTIVKVEIYSINRSENNFLLIAEEKSLLIKFDFIDPNDGIRFKILHTGPVKDFSFSCPVIGLSGKGANFVKSNIPDQSSDQKQKFMLFAPLAMTLITILLLIDYFFMDSYYFITYRYWPLSESIIESNEGRPWLYFFMLVQSIYVLYIFFKGFYQRHPKDLNKPSAK